MQRLQNPNQRNIDSLNNVGRAASKHFRKKNKGNLKGKID